MKKYTQKFVVKCRYIIRDKEIKIGNFEKNIGVSIGYFSRLKKHSEMSLDTALKACDFLNMSLYEILEYDNNKMEKERIKKEIEELNKLLKELDAEVSKDDM